ncbi:hypothetical protein GYMLUDRAFT_41424 [Collybiopsis luxurians FD-317 M1]|uniref:Metallo-beta-lactamase domain-containing protein n=1 Tax=Collybiopsis luxurians FD-317 M1 TaxID=944289 RepID=A0A0D0C4Q5_9AGAR|nr:hypothetical protein GYMLUDRAFT_41424 [Collybiopsis luxurians FD-317 M1]
MPSRRSAFRATRLSSSTFLIKEFDDIYAEHPHIYAIIIPKFESTGVISSAPTGTILLIDTGCGGASNDPNIEITNLREFIETVEIPDNGGRPLNGGHGRMNYIVVTTHCHYDHIRRCFYPSR